MKCTECHKRTDHLHSERWNCKLGYIINKGERLCDNCAEKRYGFLQVGDLLKEKEKLLKKANENVPIY